MDVPDAYTENPHQMELVANDLYEFYSSKASWEIYNDALAFLKVLTVKMHGMATVGHILATLGHILARLNSVYCLLTS